MAQLFTEVLHFFTAGLHMNQQLNPNEDFYLFPNKPKAEVTQSYGAAALCTDLCKHKALETQGKILNASCVKLSIN